jgi:hypothetical protein
MRFIELLMFAATIFLVFNQNTAHKSLSRIAKPHNHTIVFKNGTTVFQNGTEWRTGNATKLEINLSNGTKSELEAKQS